MSNLRQKNKELALSLVIFAVSMLFLAYAYVPLYAMFCKITGYGGTVQQAIAPNLKVGSRLIKVYFDSNVDESLPWKFKPQQKSMDVLTGTNVLAFYLAENISDEDIIGTAIYNVTPYKSAIYFNKVYCFCYEEQLLKAKTKVLMPVSFYIDPDFDKDENMIDVHDITLSYSFFLVRKVKN